MIEKMKQITLVVSRKEMMHFISKLRKAGVLHVKHINPPRSHEISFIEDRLAKVESLISALEPYENQVHQDFNASSHERNVLFNAEQITEILGEKKEFLEKIEDLSRQMEWFQPWGDFDPKEIESLREKGVNIHLYYIHKKEFNKLPKDKCIHVIRQTKGMMYIAVISMGTEEKLPFNEIKYPAESPVDISRQIDYLKTNIKKIDNQIKDKARTLAQVKRCRDKLKKEHEVLKVKFGMQDEEKFAYIQGYCPVKALGKIKTLADAHNLGYVVGEPKDPDNVPTLITNPRWVKIIDPVFNFMNTLPGYEEFDISMIFLIFFSLFFAMLIGDAGYGAIFLVTTFFIRRKFRKLPGEPFFLMYLLSTATIIWGVITGTYFGVEKIAQLPILRNLVISNISSFSDTSQNFVIFLCFIIGAVQLTVAHLMRALKVIGSILAVAQVGWMMIIWGMFFAAGKFVIGRSFPPAALWLLFAGMGMVLFCSNPQKGIIKGALATLADLPLSVISAFSDIVSYLRLFAVGFATVVVAESFNSMAVGDGINSVLGGLIAAIILFFGHMLNIILGFMAVIVHGIRLNMLEFSGHLGMQWTGKKYEPFKE